MPGDAVPGDAVPGDATVPAGRRRARRVAPIGVLVALAAVPAVALAGLWRFAASSAEPASTTTTTTLPDVPPEPAGALPTPVLSFRRLPESLAERRAQADADAELAARSSELTGRLTGTSCALVRAGDAAIVDEPGGGPVMPASSQKLLVAAVALDVLGPDHRFVTELQSAAPVAGVIAGDLYLVGGGDPVLATADMAAAEATLEAHPAINTTALEPLADELVAAGVTTIQGDVVGDGSRYDDEYFAPTWTNDVRRVEAGPYDALLVNDGQLGTPGNYAVVPSRAAASVLLDLLRARGIAVTGAAAERPRPLDGTVATVASIESLPLRDVLVEMLHTSDNNTAEMLVKELGVAVRQEGTRQAGLDVIRAKLDEWRVPTEGLQLADGSGLSRENRATCATLAGTFGAPVGDELLAALPVAGRDGTLAGQLAGTPAEGTMHAKTGTLTGVKALAGVQPGREGEPVAFALVLNGPGVDAPDVYAPAWAALSELIAGYPVAVTPDVAPFEPLEPLEPPAL